MHDYKNKYTLFAGIKSKNMANKIHLGFLKRGITTWNEWRKEEPRITPDLRGVNLNDQDLSDYDFEGVDFYNAQFKKAILNRAKFKNANLKGANFSQASILGSDFSSANLKGANFTRSKASKTSISSKKTKFSKAKIQETKFTKAVLNNADFTNAKAGFFNFLGEGHLWIIIWTLFIGFWSAFPAFIMLTFYMYFLGIFQRKIHVILIFSSILSSVWAIFIRWFLKYKLEIDGFIEIHIAIGTAMIFMVVISELVAIKLNRSNKKFTAQFFITVIFITFLVLTIFYMEGILKVFGHNIQDPNIISNAKAVFGAVVGAGYGAWVSNLAIKGEEFSLLWRIYLEDIVSFGTSFKYATLDDATFDSSTLTGANFIGAKINRTSWWEVEDLDFIIPGDKYLKYPQIRKIFQYSNSCGDTREIEELNFDDFKLDGINLSHQKLNGVSLRGTSLSNSDLSSSNLEDANLTFSNLSGANLSDSSLTGAYLKDIRYDQHTVFENVNCKYVNLNDPLSDRNHNRFPPEQDFRSGDFESIFKKEDTLKLLIRHPYNIQAIDSVLPEIIRDFKISSNLFKGIRKLGDDLLIEFQIYQEILDDKNHIEKQFESRMQEKIKNQAHLEQNREINDNQPSTLIIFRIINIINGNYSEDIAGDYRQSN